jgi:hypothetical protein
MKVMQRHPCVHELHRTTMQFLGFFIQEWQALRPFHGLSRSRRQIQNRSLVLILMCFLLR